VRAINPQRRGAWTRKRGGSGGEKGGEGTQKLKTAVIEKTECQIKRGNARKKWVNWTLKKKKKRDTNKKRAGKATQLACGVVNKRTEKTKGSRTKQKEPKEGSNTQRTKEKKGFQPLPSKRWNPKE